MLKKDKLITNAHDIMDKQKFMHKLDIALHWYLPKAEANEVLTEYQDMQRQAGKNGGDIFHIWEKPQEIAQGLQNPREYRRWLRLFWVLLLCFLFPFYYLLSTYTPFYFFDNIPLKFTQFLLMLCLALTLFFSHRLKKQSGEPGRSYWIFAANAALLIFNSAFYALIIHHVIEYCLNQHSAISSNLIFNCMFILIIINGAACLFSLLNCRLRNCRWLGVFVIGMTMLLAIMYCINMLEGFAGEKELLRFYLDQLKECLPPLACSMAASLKILW